MNEPAAILLIGPTGSGKTPLGELLQREGLRGRRCFHFDFGERIRRIVTGADAPGELSDEEVAFLARVLRSGALLEDEHFGIAEKILGGFLAAREVGRDDLVVLNGLPRHAGQARDVARLVNVRALVELACPAEAVDERIRADTGGDRRGRRDDDRRAVRRKLETYHSRTAALREHYRRAGAAAVTVNVAADTTAPQMREAIERSRPAGGAWGNEAC